MGHFAFFQLIKNYAETTLLIDKKYISQEASHTANKAIEDLNLRKLVQEKIVLLDSQKKMIFTI